MIKAPKKLIEVALPLDDINDASAREKNLRHGHPSTLHLWWARRPLAAARAVLFAQLVNDPGGERGYYKGKTKAQADAEREKLFEIIRDLVKWENTSNQDVLDRARQAIRTSWQETCEINKGEPGFDLDKMPAFYDPFAGGGAIPLEAQRLGLESFASDLNPVAVLINKAMIEIPSKHAGQIPIGPIPEYEKQVDHHQDSSGAKGLGEDVRRYGHWMRNEAFKLVGEFYPKVEISKEEVDERQDLAPFLGQRLTVVAWLWARTVKSPNPAFSDVDVPLVSSFVISDKPGKEAYVELDRLEKGFSFRVRKGKVSNWQKLKKGTKLSRNSFRCALSNTPIELSYIKEQAQLGRMGQRLMAIVAEGIRGKVFLGPQRVHEEIVGTIGPQWAPTLPLPERLTGGTCHAYGMEEWGKVFTRRQLLILNTLSGLIEKAYSKIEVDAKAHGCSNPSEYAKSVATYLAFLISQVANHSASICGWNAPNTQMRSVFARQAIPMSWDFAESNPFSTSTGSFHNLHERMCKGFVALGNRPIGHAAQADAQEQTMSADKIVSTDPPYYDNIAYADLSDFFYVWQRNVLKDFYPDLFSTMATPKQKELVAMTHRHGTKDQANKFFESGISVAIRRLAESANAAYPMTIYYAFKQTQTTESGTSSSGWETFLEAVIQSGLEVTGTWPIRTEKKGRSVGIGTNALASSIVLSCRPRGDAVETITRRQFQQKLRVDMPEALETMIGGSSGRSPIAPVDLAQSAIGPGMSIFSQYDAVLNQDGSKMSVHDALVLINRTITDNLNPDSGSFDNDTLFCDSWFSEYGWSTGGFGQANVLAQGKGTTVDGVRDAGVIESGGGKVRLLKWQEYPTGWDPKQDNRTPVWEALHQLIRALNQEGETGAGELLAGMPERGESIRQLAYHLYTFCDHKKWAEDARAYNELIASWHAIVAASHEVGQHGTQVQMELDVLGSE